MGLFDFLSSKKPLSNAGVLLELSRALSLSIGPSQDVFEKGKTVVRGTYQGVPVEIAVSDSLHILYSSGLNLDFLIGTRSYVPANVGTPYNLVGASQQVLKVSRPPNIVNSFIMNNSRHLQKLVALVGDAQWEVYFFEKGFRIQADKAFTAPQVVKVFALGLAMYHSLDRLIQ